MLAGNECAQCPASRRGWWPGPRCLALINCECGEQPLVRIMTSPEGGVRGGSQAEVTVLNIPVRRSLGAIGFFHRTFLLLLLLNHTSYHRTEAKSKTVLLNAGRTPSLTVYSTWEVEQTVLRARACSLPRICQIPLCLMPLNPLSVTRLTNQRIKIPRVSTRDRRRTREAAERER